MLFDGDPDFPMDEARGILGPYEEVFRKAILDSADLILQIGRNHPIVAKAYEYLATRQHLMNAIVVETIKELVTQEKLPATELTTVNRFAELQVGGIYVRFKQVDKAGNTKNYPTKAAIDYRNQLPQPSLLDNEEPEPEMRARLTLGWRWTVTATAIEDIVFSYIKGDDVRWKYSLLRDAGEEGGSSGIAINEPKSPESGPGVVFPIADKKKKGGA